MTLIVTAVTRTAVIQASDRRLTLPHGRGYDDKTNKAICVACADARFAIAYTGLGVIPSGGVRRATDMWILDFLIDIRAGDMPVWAIAQAIQQHATATFRSLRKWVDPKYLRHTFVLSGFWAGSPFLISISNHEDKSMQIIAGIKDDFSSLIWSNKQWPRTGRTDFLIHGTESATDGHVMRRIEQKSTRMFRQSNDTAAQTLVSLIRAAARHPKCGKYIGRNCMSVVVPVEGPIQSIYHPDGASPEIYAPHFITSGMAVWGASIWVGEGPPPWWK